MQPLSEFLLPEALPIVLFDELSTVARYTAVWLTGYQDNAAHCSTAYIFPVLDYNYIFGTRKKVVNSFFAAMHSEILHVFHHISPPIVLLIYSCPPPQMHDMVSQFQIRKILICRKCIVWPSSSSCNLVHMCVLCSRVFQCVFVCWFSDISAWLSSFPSASHLQCLASPGDFIMMYYVYICTVLDWRLSFATGIYWHQNLVCRWMTFLLIWITCDSTIYWWLSPQQFCICY